MATEKGIVTKIGPATAWVKTTKTKSCESCAAREGCHTLGGGKEMEVEVLNSTGAGVGDTVIISFEDASLLKLSFLIYIFPILAMIAGAVSGQEIALHYHFSPPAFSVVSGLLFFFLSFFIIRKTGKKLSEKEQYRPRIIRIAKRIANRQERDFINNVPQDER